MLIAGQVHSRYFCVISSRYRLFLLRWYIPLSQLSKEGNGKAREGVLSHRLQLWRNGGERGYTSSQLSEVGTSHSSGGV